MKTIQKLWFCLILLATLLSQIGCGQRREADRSKPSQTDVLEMKSVSRTGHFFVTLQLAGQDHRLNFKVKDELALCVNSSDPLPGRTPPGVIKSG